MAKEITFRGKTLSEIKKMELNQFLQLVTSRVRRGIKRGFTEQQKLLLKRVKAVNEGKSKKPIRTHCRNMAVLPEMVGLMIYIHSGNEFVPVKITEEMLGHYLGELVITRKKVQHSAPGIGATKSSTAQASKAK